MAGHHRLVAIVSARGLAVVLALFSGFAAAQEGNAIVTALAGNVRVEAAESGRVVDAFERFEARQRLVLEPGARLRIIYPANGRQEIWNGAGVVEVGEAGSRLAGGAARAEHVYLPAHVARLLARTPLPDGKVPGEPLRTRSMPSGGTLESIERNYGNLRRAAAESDRNPELYLLAGYLDLKEFDRVLSLVQQMREAAPADVEVKVITALYTRAVANARMARGMQ
jgi:hypothetical protein